MRAAHVCPSFRSRTAFIALLASAALGAGCNSATSTDAVDAAARGSAPAAVAPGSGFALAERAVAKDVVVAQDALQPPSAPQPQGVAQTGMIIRNGSASIEVDSLEIAVAAVRALATTLGGYIGNVSMNTGEYTVRSATIEVKIPAARFEEAVTGLTPIGKVENSMSTAEDVGEEFVDLTARAANSRRLEDRLVTLLATRTGKLEDVLAVERELARVREEIERYEGRLRYLRTRVATSTLSVTVHESAPMVNPNPGTSIIVESFANMWRNFVHFIAMLIESLGVLVPVGVLVGGAFWMWRRWRRSARSTVAPSAPTVG